MKLPPSIIALIALPGLTFGAKVELPEWNETTEAASFALGGGLWPVMPGVNAALDAKERSFVVETETIGESKSDRAKKFYGPQGLDETLVADAKGAGEKDPITAPVLASTETETEAVIDPAIAPKVVEEQPAFIPLPPLEGELADIYFATAPVEYLVDPQRLLTEQKSNDISRFLEFHADEAEFAIYVMVLGETQKIPSDVDLQKLHQDWFSETPSVLMMYYREKPEMTELVLNDSVRASLPKSVFERIRQNCLREGAATEHAPDQVEKMAIELSIQLYWLGRLIEHEGKGGTVDPATTTALEMPASETAPELHRDYAPGLFVEDSTKALTYVLIVFSVLAVLAILALAVWITVLWRNRSKSTGKPLLFPEFEIVPRLGGQFSGGGYVGMSFDIGDTATS